MSKSRDVAALNRCHRVTVPSAPQLFIMAIPRPKLSFVPPPDYHPVGIGLRLATTTTTGRSNGDDVPILVHRTTLVQGLGEVAVVTTLHHHN
ncbi:hypothetical protein L6452_02127 [Arctium lappa]|uniref:Uncharacterized protein n=1 Tax=Arctium lappa TaxID=4217 RepID=A0ACB9FHZ8_ARCLA|nr:hypothetical protein L6452_02127 [Arctium lappa]